MDFRELLNKIDAVNTEAKKEPERLAFADAIDHVKDIKFTPPLPSGIKFSSANNIKFRGQDINDPKVKLALFQDELKNSPARLLGEIGSRIKPTSDAQMDLSGHIAALGEKLASGSNSLAQLSEPEKKLAIEAIKSALRGMELERDPDQSEYKDDEDETESIEAESGIMYKAGVKKYGKEGMRKIQSAAGKGASSEEIGAIKDKHNKKKNEEIEEDWFQGQTSVTLEGDSFYETFGWIGENEENIEEAEYQGRTVKLNKPMRGDVKKFKVYVKNPKGNVVKVNFGDPDMKIKKSNPARRRSFRARHNCDTPGPKHKARYWSCRKW